ncbi:hypothetical protein HED22_17135 [Thalassospira sp. HF15]|uniref:hypothetical protein n=1 Tax=Thalassospira sp. HF15 TaxID=2722755 RepID=UPI00142F70FB|nr:hypothetical protein [Thalassospira sp. HF15]NIY77381.1 hypothetical protein [Thalassospira sp. HF15]
MGFDGQNYDVSALLKGFCAICKKAEFSQKCRKTGSIPSSAHKIPNQFHGDPWEDHLKTGIWVLMDMLMIWICMGLSKTICDLMANRV